MQALQATERSFFFLDKTTQLEAIETLSPQGDQLHLLDQILRTSDDVALKGAALQRLSGSHSFIATSALVRSLDDPATDVAATALQMLSVNGDISLVPLLREKMTGVSDPAVRRLYSDSIRKMEASVAMGMDN